MDFYIIFTDLHKAGGTFLRLQIVYPPDLRLLDSEKSLLDEVTAQFGQVILILNMVNTMEMDENGRWQKEKFHYKNAPEGCGYFVFSA